MNNWDWSAAPRVHPYMSFKTQHLQFLDVRSYLAPNYSYDAFIKAYKCKIEKGFFPYDFLDSYDKLNYPKLPPHESFFNKLKNKISLMKNIIFVQMLGRITT
jgi:hypothetical protein